MQITHKTDNQQMTLRLSGRFDFNAHREFREVSQAAVGDPGIREIVIDFSGVDYLDSSALGLLLLLRERTTASGQKVTLRGVRGTVASVLQVANFNKLFTYGD